MQDIPLIQRVTIPEPCPIKWRSMHGSSTVRACRFCERHVYDLSAMSAEEAESVIEAHGGKLCAQIRRRRNGSIITREARQGSSRARRWIAACIALFASTCSFTLGGCSSRTGGVVCIENPKFQTMPETSSESDAPESAGD